MTDYGPLSGLVGSVGAILAAGAAITLAWVRNANWTPPENDVPTGPPKVAGLLTSVAIAGLWFETGKALRSHDLEKIAIWCAVATLVFLLVYSFLMGVFIYHREIATGPNKTERIRTTGGLWLTRDARVKLKKAKTIQRLFAGAAYDHDLIWSRVSRSIVKTFLIVSFLGLQVCGSIAIATVALSADPKAAENSQKSP
jgi:hypothetical protein